MRYLEVVNLLHLLNIGFQRTHVSWRFRVTMTSLKEAIDCIMFLWNLHGKWFSDEAIVEFLLLSFPTIGAAITTKDVNKYIQGILKTSQVYESTDFKKQVTISTNVRHINKRRIFFYYFRSEISTEVRLLHTTKEWVNAYFSNHIKGITASVLKKQSENMNKGKRNGSVTTENMNKGKCGGDKHKHDDDTSTTTPTKRLQFDPSPSSLKKAKEWARTFWESSEMMKLFSLPPPRTQLGDEEHLTSGPLQKSADINLIHYIDTLNAALISPMKLKQLIDPNVRDYSISPSQMLLLSQRCMILRSCYITALQDMEREQHWGKCISSTLEILGMSKSKRTITIHLMHRQFRQKLTFIHPNKRVQPGKTLAPTLFVIYPEAR